MLRVSLIFGRSLFCMNMYNYTVLFLYIEFTYIHTDIWMSGCPSNETKQKYRHEWRLTTSAESVLRHAWPRETNDCVRRAWTYFRLEEYHSTIFVHRPTASIDVDYRITRCGSSGVVNVEVVRIKFFLLYRFSLLFWFFVPTLHISSYLWCYVVGFLRWTTLFS